MRPRELATPLAFHQCLRRADASLSLARTHRTPSPRSLWRSPDALNSHQVTFLLLPDLRKRPSVTQLWFEMTRAISSLNESVLKFSNEG